MLKFPVGISIEAIDNATAKTREITAGLVKATKPLDRFGKAFKGLSEASGFPRLMDGLRGVGDAIGELGDAAKRAGLLVGGLVAAAGGALFALVRSYAEAGDSAIKGAQKIGIGVEALQELRYAAKLANVETEELDSSLIKLTRNVALAARGDRAAARPFDRLGIAIRDANGHLRDAADLLPEIADKFQDLDDPLKKVALAQELFGKSGADLLPLLSGGSRELRAMGREARALGVVLSREDAAAGEEFMDALTRIGAALAGARNEIGRELLPVLLELAKRFRAWITDNLPAVRDFARRLAEDLPVAIEKARAGFERFWAQTEPVRALLAKIYDLIGPIGVGLGVLAGIITVTLVPAIFSTIAALAALSTAIVATPAGWIVAAIAAVVAAFAALAAAVALVILKWDWISDRWPKTTRLALALGKALLEHILTPIILIAEAVGKLIDKFEELISTVPDWVLNLIGADTSGLSVGSKGAAKDSGQSAPKTGAVQTSGEESDFARAMRDLADASENMRTATVQPPNVAPRIGAAGQPTKSEATVKVELSGLPRGSRVETEKKGDVDLDLALGYALQFP